MMQEHDHGLAARLYRKIRLIRRMEEVVAEIYPSDKIKSPVHLSIGQEAISVAFCDPLRRQDVVSMTYRGHAAFLAKGGSPKGMMAELYGKRDGVAHGIAGSMHLVDMENGILGASAVVGTSIPVAVGYAMAIKMRREDRVVVCFLGDGATEEGVFPESLNFAALHRLPILFVCENNGLAIHSPLANRWAQPDLCRRVEGYGVPAHRFEDMDTLVLRTWADERIGAIRSGQAEGPYFVECPTYRWLQHVGPTDDHDQGYRDDAVAADWRARDEVERLGGALPAEIRAEIDAEVEKIVADAVAFAEASPFPAPGELKVGAYA
ncbi:thiamine pyrophosphate-dependent dehydrogenase E1 component subunit alpha [Hwanghaeella sp.]|uniref:thiamine pyrophosphate-dependent dehydrogenase E1 component subunit alpha n=1 Tax=Hwanghaeella sp. TaxID=2605943 RepID=UPI003CCC28A1